MTPQPIRVTAVLTHPVQYFSPWFRSIAAHQPALDLTVLYGAVPSAEQQGSGFGQAFTWDVPLTDGYRFEVCGESAGKRFDSDSFFGLDVRDIGHRIAATRPDIVLVTGWHSVMQVRALAACRTLRIPTLYRGDSTVYSGPRRLLRPLWSLKSRTMLRRFDAFLSVGRDATDYLRSLGVPDSLIFSSPHCVDNDRFAAAADRLRCSEHRARLRTEIGASETDFVVLFAGKLQDRKRPIDAVAAVAALGSSAVLLVAGDGPLASEMRACARREGVRLAWKGFLNQSQLPEAFAASDCLLVPSAWESWGLILNEALASGVPCVATTRVAAARDLIVEGETGFVAQPGDIAGLSAQLRRVQALRGAAHDFSAACRAHVASYGFAQATDGLLAASRHVLGRHRATPDSVPQFYAH